MTFSLNMANEIQLKQALLLNIFLIISVLILESEKLDNL